MKCVEMGRDEKSQAHLLEPDSRLFRLSKLLTEEGGVGVKWTGSCCCRWNPIGRALITMGIIVATIKIAAILMVAVVFFILELTCKQRRGLAKYK